ncbi:MAG TPA: hypothetical protein VGN68_07865 [Sphingopyxis sp.]|jgi:hypothetical protein|uniref:hypothetical protein n=1 Tax=Sphingopyxis sp. TaxID=1908224 RepID=UPI002E12E742|nr:hypothetical protein [Sphingopyxis sp.]
MIEFTSSPTLWAAIVALAILAMTYARNRSGDARPEYTAATKRQKVICLLFLASLLGTAVIYYAGFELFGGYEQQAFKIAQAAMILYALLIISRLQRV